MGDKNPKKMMKKKKVVDKSVEVAAILIEKDTVKKPIKK